jgi:glyoxylase-like metal-dependent hydrolase (beta-lactamase superfamily II)
MMKVLSANYPVKIFENLWQVGGDDLSGPGDAAIYLAWFGKTAALFDSGCGSGHQLLVENIACCLHDGASLDYLFLTHAHYDHSGGAASVRDCFGCKIVVHEKDAGFLETGDTIVTAAHWYGKKMAAFKVDIKMKQDKSVFSLGDGWVTAYHAPGHSPGSVVYVLPIENQTVLIGQDIHGPLHPDLLSDREAYVRSLRKIMDIDADVLCEGHFGIYRGKESVRKFISSYLDLSESYE